MLQNVATERKQWTEQRIPEGRHKAVKLCTQKC